MSEQKTCDRNYCDSEAVAVIPMPHGEVRGSGERRASIHVCEIHFQEAVGDLFFVVRYDESPSQADARHERYIDEKHKRLRGALAA